GLDDVEPDMLGRVYEYFLSQFASAEGKKGGLKADFILANPPFNVSDWGGERLRDDKRWKYSSPQLESVQLFWRRV
ncbi:MAG TPA: N-6 DNA methylase, partial [Syntrophales bacterium]|nr:N-6 DNA methylase [Syntrophales bacterium]